MNNCVRLLSIISIIIIFIAFLSCKQVKSKNTSSDNESSEEIEIGIRKEIIENEKLVVGFEPDSPPIYYSDGTKQEGFDYDLIRYISKEIFENAKIQVKEAGYDELPEMLDNGTIQIMAGGRTKEKGGNILYSKSYLSFGFCVITKRENKNKYNSLSKLRNKKIGVYDEYAQKWVNDNVGDADVQVIGTNEDEDTPESDWMASLVDGDLDAIIYDYPFATNEIEDYGNKLTISNGNINGKELNEYVLGISSKSTGAKNLIQLINSAIRDYKESEQYSEAISKYIPNPGLDEVVIDISDARVYKIKQGETLSKLAKTHLGDSDKWEVLYDLNSSVLVSPDIIYPGQKIKIPENWD
jgi:ABC-type amino acid transport substrate-binding protein